MITVGVSVDSFKHFSLCFSVWPLRCWVERLFCMTCITKSQSCSHIYSNEISLSSCLWKALWTKKSSRSCRTPASSTVFSVEPEVCSWTASSEPPLPSSWWVLTTITAHLLTFRSIKWHKNYIYCPRNVPKSSITIPCVILKQLYMLTFGKLNHKAMTNFTLFVNLCVAS